MTIAHLSSGEDEPWTQYLDIATPRESVSPAPSSGLRRRGTTTPGDDPDFDTVPPSEQQLPRKSRSQAPDYTSDIPIIGFQDLAGIDKVVSQLEETVVAPFTHPEVFAKFPNSFPRGVLLHGPCGTGKTALALAVAHEVCHRAQTHRPVSFFRLAATEIVSSLSGDSESRIRSLFDEASQAAPALVVIDDIDAIAAVRDNRGMESRIVSQLGSSMERLHDTYTEGQVWPVVVLATTSRPSLIESSLRREGRLSTEIGIPIPDTEAREAIIRAHMRRLAITPAVLAAVPRLAVETPGYVASDVVALMREATSAAVRRFIATEGEDDPNGSQLIDLTDFLEALHRVKPTAQREGFSTVPNVSWADVGALEETRDQLDMLIQAPIAHRKSFAALGLTQASGVLLCGPPGCGKTLMARAVANSSGCSFISVKGPELLNKYVGESERAVRAVFERARASQPCVVFFDELDALLPRRGSGENQAAERVVNQFLTELDGTENRGQVFVLGATNRPELIDPALLRSGRFGARFFVPLPDREGRMSILRTQLRKVPIDGRDSAVDPCETPSCGARPLNLGSLPSAVEIDEAFQQAGFTSAAGSARLPERELPEWAEVIAERTSGYSGADLQALIDGARRLALKEYIAVVRVREQIEHQRLVLLRERLEQGIDRAVAELEIAPQLPLPPLPQLLVTERHFMEALANAKPTISHEDRERYERLQHQIEEEARGV